MGYEKRPSPLTAIKEAAYQSLLGNTAAAENVFKNRPTPVWAIELEPAGALCLYFTEGRGDDRKQDFPTWYIHENFFVVECLAQALEGSDDMVEALAQEAWDIITLNRFLKNPVTGANTVDKLKYSHYTMALKGGGPQGDQPITSLCMYFRLWLEQTLAPAADSDFQEFLRFKASHKVGTQTATDDPVRIRES